MPVPDPACSRAVLIGIGTYTHAALAPLPAAVSGAQRLAALLRDPSVWGLPPEHVTEVGVEASPSQVLAAVRDSAKQATDTLLVYFAGHGLRDRNEQLYLALADADADHPQIGTLLYRTVRDVLRQAGYRARYRVTVLDCCYSGLAGTQSSTSIPTRADLAQALDEPPAEQADGAAEDYGDCVLTSAPPTQPSFVPPGSALPEFTGELVSVLEHGVTDGGSLLSLDDIWQRVRRRMRDRNSPEPQQFAQNTVARQVQFHNRATGPTPGRTARATDTASPWQSQTETDYIRRLTAAGGRLYAGDFYGNMQALDGATGALLWSHRIGLGDRYLLNYAPEAAVTDEAVYISSGDAHLRVLDATTGTTLWTAEGTRRWHKRLTSCVGPVVAEGTVCFRGGDGSVQVLDAATGTLRWTLAGATRMWDGVPPVVAGGALYFSSADGSVHSLDAMTGTTRWVRGLEGHPIVPPVVAGGMVHVLRKQSLYALDLTGTIRWTQGWPDSTIPPRAYIKTPIVADGTLHIDRRMSLRALDARTGTTRWTHAIDGYLSNPFPVEYGMLYVTWKQQIQALDAWSGTPRWTHAISSADGGIAVADGRLYFRSAWNLIQALNATTGGHLWTHALPNAGTAPLVVANGLVYIGFGSTVCALHALTGRASA